MEQVEKSKSLASGIEESCIRRNDSVAEASSNRDGRKRSLSARSLKLMKELKEKAIEAEEILASVTSDDKENDASSAQPHYTKRTLSPERLMRTITEESRSYSISIRSNSVRSNTSNKRKPPPGFYNPIRLNARIADFDIYLEKEDAVHTSYRERLREIRGVFDDFRSYRIRRDVPGSMNLQNLDVEVQVACLAQRNVKEFTHLLLNTTLPNEIKSMLRYYLFSSEEAARPSRERDTSNVLQEMKDIASSIERTPKANSTEILTAAPKADELTLRRDVDEVRAYLRHIFCLRYQHVPFEFRDSYRPRIDSINAKHFATYIRWQTTRDDTVASLLADDLGLHPVELDHVLQPRLENMLHKVGVDAEYVISRLMDLDNIWHWVYEYNQLAHNAQWAKLAGQFHDDREQFHKIFPGEMIHVDPERGIHESNPKALVYVEMIQIRGHFFAKIDSPTKYKLSKTAKGIDRRHRREQEMIKQEMKEEERIRNERIKLERIERNERYTPKRGSKSMEELAAARGVSQERPASEPSMFKPNTLNRLKGWVKRTREAVAHRTNPRVNCDHIGGL
ncbi:MAG: hypothetical protein Q9225_004770 [Loekoesia sp. 1 TL-2023]